MTNIVITTNAKQVAQKLGVSATRIALGVNVALKKGAFLIEREGKQRAPVDTGRLRNSIQTSMFSVSAEIKPTVNYAIFVHEGTRRMRARPFMRDAERASERELVEIFQREVRRAIS